MGVRGLGMYIEKNDYANVVHIEEEIRMWKRKNPILKPIIVFDILGLSYLDNGMLCGGSSIDFDREMENWFIRLKKCGAELVFIQDVAVEIGKEDVWIDRGNKDFQEYLEMYKDIQNKTSLTDLNIKMEKLEWGWKVSPNLAPIASKYGKYLFARAGRARAHEIAYYAKKHNAMAIFSADTDFLIFEGDWKLWIFKNLDFETFTAIEYDRFAINRLFSLSFQQRPLFATLLGNDFTKKYPKVLNEFYCRLGDPRNKFSNVAHFIRQIMRRADLSADVVDKIAMEVFGSSAPDNKRQLIQNSVDSYDLRLQAGQNIENDPIEAKLIALSVKAVKNYRKLKSNSTLPISVAFNDMATAASSTILTDFLVEILRKKLGIMYHDEASDKTFKIIKKISREENYAAYNETPIAPDFSLPVLTDLLTKDDSDDELNETRWNLLAWMLSISVGHRDGIRSMDKEFRVTSATLLALVQRKILTVDAADGVLLTEIAFKTNQLEGRGTPKFLKSAFVRAAHIYRTARSAIERAFITVGLISSISDLYIFDGVYYQSLMAQAFPADLFKEIQPYRIYAN